MNIIKVVAIAKTFVVQYHLANSYHFNKHAFFVLLFFCFKIKSTSKGIAGKPYKIALTKLFRRSWVICDLKQIAREAVQLRCLLPLFSCMIMSTS